MYESLRTRGRAGVAAVGAALAVSLSACMNPPAAPESPGTPPPTLTVPTVGGCPASGAAVSIGVKDAASGLRVVGLELTNCGTVPYLVSGYPQIGLLDEGQRSIEVMSSHGSPGGVTDPGPHALTLQPGDRATAILSWHNTVLIGGGAVTATWVTVTPTTAEAAQPLALNVDIGTTGAVKVTAWQIGSTQ